MKPALSNFQPTPNPTTTTTTTTFGSNQQLSGANQQSSLMGKPKEAEIDPS